MGSIFVTQNEIINFFHMKKYGARKNNLKYPDLFLPLALFGTPKKCDPFL
jgi:hypothetical protein